MKTVFFDLLQQVFRTTISISVVIILSHINTPVNLMYIMQTLIVSTCCFVKKTPYFWQCTFISISHCLVKTATLLYEMMFWPT